MSSILEQSKYSGLRLVIRGPPMNRDITLTTSPSAGNLDIDALEIEDDMEGEKETMAVGQGGEDEDEEEDLFDKDEQGMDIEDTDQGSDEGTDSDSDSESEDEDGNVKMANLSDLRTVITEASKGVVESTDAEYKRLIKLAEKFVHKHGFIKDSENLFTSSPHPETPTFIVAWIMDSCDDVGLDGQPKDRSVARGSYAHAQKMRAATTYGFGRLHGRGSIPWQQSEVNKKMRGNPSISETVAQYMVSLRKKKVRAGEVATSARAITTDILYKLYHYNHKTGVGDIKPITRRSRKNPLVDVDPNEWGGGRTRLMLHAVYVISFLCLLRFDEALKIQVQDIRQLDEHSFELKLPFRKTSQYGDIKPFVLHEWPDVPHLCPVRALTAWLAEYRPLTGYLFPPISARDQVGDGTKPMNSGKFLELFRNNLLDLRLDPWPYGTHSFRRGGTQYFATHRRWSLRRICEWGGWSMEFSNLTIVKYLIGWNDDPTELREDFLNPKKKITTRCATCGRTCSCGM